MNEITLLLKYEHMQKDNIGCRGLCVTNRQLRNYGTVEILLSDQFMTV